MSITMKIHPILHHHTNAQDMVKVKGHTVGECLDDLAKKFPGIEKELFDKDGKLFNYIDIYVNLKSSYPEELAKLVKDGDELHITYIVAGG